MANDTLGLNISFPIYGEDGLPFHDLIINKSSYESTAMSLEEKISGDFYYKDNTLSFSMKEYVEYNGIHYVLVNPPTIVREGLVSDNSEAKGMTKYSVVFYHPMCLLSNLPFSDVAVRADEVKYLSENKKFSWIGYPDDYIAKLNKNLQNTQWIVVKSSRFPNEKNKELSKVLSFDNNTIADALSTWHDTWKLPFVVDKVNEDEEMYATGKRFKIVMGMASNEIYASDTDRETPFVFHMGQGVGLKNNSRTPRNNKIVTRISGYGSENNIPFGYPQIRWYGDSRWDYTEYEGNIIHYDDKGKVTNTPKASAYPLYKGILGGEYVKLIKHPFTRNHLMPSIYRDTLFNKVSPYDEEGNINENYNPNIELVDYYDAVYSEEYPYVNTINVQAPNFEIHEFDEIKPELDADRAIGLIKVLPLNDDLSVADKWIDDMDENEKYEQSYFSVQLPRLDFDLYACASITEEMQINMRSGACIGCTFPIQVDWDDYKVNFYDSEGNFAPDGVQRNLDKYPKSNLGSISIIAKKENSTFGTVMPNVYQYPQSGDKFVFLGISLPESYITNAEVRLDKAMKSYMLENNVYYFDYPLKFDEFFLKENVNILRQIRPNTIIRFEFNNEELSLSVKQIAINYGSAVLPQYNITLTDNVEVSMNAIGQVADDVENLSTMLSVLREEYDNNVWKQILSKLSKTDDDKASGVITFLKGILFGDTNYGIDEKGKANLLSLLSQSINNTGKIVTKDLTVSGVLDVFQLVIDKIKAASGGLIISPADGFTVDVVERTQYINSNVFKITYLENPNNGYIDTGVVPTNNTRIKARVMFERPLSNDLQVLYGATADNVDEYFDVDYYNGNIIYNYDSTKMAITVDDDTNVTIVSDDLSYPYLLGMTNGESASKLLVNFGDVYDDTLDNEEGTITIDQSLSGITVGSVTKDIDFTRLDVENLSKTLYIFANNGIEGADSFCHSIKILDLKIYEGEQVIRDYCPAVHTSQSFQMTYGLYDKVNDVFKASKGAAFKGGAVPLDEYRLYWRATDSNGNQRGNMWQVGDQALCQSFNNAVVGQTREASNKKYWSLVTSVSDFNNPIEVTLPNGTSAPCHYITISKNVYTGTLSPTIGDDIVMLGNRTNTNRQFAIYLSAYDSLDTGYSGDGQVISGINAPLLAFYEGINDFNLSKHRTTFFANGSNAIQGNLKVSSGASVEDVMDGKINLSVGGLEDDLRRTGVNIEEGTITLDAEKTEVTGNLIFNGFVTPNMVHITDDNYEQYGNYSYVAGEHLYALDLDKCGTLVSVETNHFNFVVLPFIADESANRTSSERNKTRSYIGTKITVYNKGGNVLGLKYIKDDGYTTEIPHINGRGLDSTDGLEYFSVTESGVTYSGIPNNYFGIVQCLCLPDAVYNKEWVAWSAVAAGKINLP